MTKSKIIANGSIDPFIKGNVLIGTSTTVLVTGVTTSGSKYFSGVVLLADESKSMCYTIGDHKTDWCKDAFRVLIGKVEIESFI